MTLYTLSSSYGRGRVKVKCTSIYFLISFNKPGLSVVTECQVVCLREIQAQMKGQEFSRTRADESE